jgi:hypothetical protein
MDWSVMTSPTTATLYGVWGSDGSDVFAVGSYWSMSPVILHYDGTGWSEMTIPTSESLCAVRGVWGSSGSDVFAVGSGGTILHYHSAEWSVMTSPTSAELVGVWGSGDRDVFAVGAGGTILHYDGATWTSMVSGTGVWLNGVWGSSDGDVFAVGNPPGTILHYNGAVWTSMDSGVTESLSDVWGSRHSDVFAVGVGGRMVHYDGTTWSVMSSSTTQYLKGLGGTTGDVFAVGENGAILHYSNPAAPLYLPVDIKPGTCPNPIPANGKGALSVAIAGFEGFDAACIDPGSVELEGVSPLRWAVEDVATPFEPFIGKEDIRDCTRDGPDGTIDLNLKFRTQEVIAALGEVGNGDVLVLSLTGMLKEECGAQPFEGEDVVIVRGR